MYGDSFVPQFSNFGGAPSLMFGTSTRTPPSAYRGPSSSQQYYRSEMSFHDSDEAS